MNSPTTRGQFLGTAGGSAALALSGVSLLAAQPKKRPQVAAVFTEFTYRSHAHVILENILEPYYPGIKDSHEWTSPIGRLFEHWPEHFVSCSHGG